MEPRRLGRKDEVLGKPALQIALGQSRRRHGRAVMMPLLRVQIRRRRLAIALTAALVGVAGFGVLCAGKRRVRVPGTMRGDWSGVKTGEHQCQKAKQDDDMPHDALVSARRRQCIARVGAL